MANRCVSTINALPSKLRYGAVRARAIRYGGFAIEAELPCVNGLTAWFTIAHVDAIDDHELLMTEGAIGSAKDIAEAIVKAFATPAPSPAGGVREAADVEFVAKTAEDVHAATRNVLRMCQISAGEVLDESLDRQKLRLAIFNALELPTINAQQAAITARRLADSLSPATAARGGTTEDTP